MDEQQNTEQMSGSEQMVGVDQGSVGTDFKPRTPQTSGVDKKKPKVPVIFVLIIVIVVAILGIVFILNSRGETTETITAPSESLSTPPTSTPTPTPIEEIDRNVSIEVLNGTGVAKEASYLQGKLATLGYEDIETGNSDSSNKEVTTVTFSAKIQEAVKDELTEELKKLYEEVSVKSSSSLKVDVSIVTGLRKGQSLPTATPTAGATATPTPSATGTITPTPTPTGTITP